MFPIDKVILRVMAVRTVVVQGQTKTVTVPTPFVLKKTTATITKTRFQLLGRVTSTATETTLTTDTVVALSTSTASAYTATTVTSIATTTSYGACQTVTWCRRSMARPFWTRITMVLINSVAPHMTLYQQQMCNTVVSLLIATKRRVEPATRATPF